MSLLVWCGVSCGRGGEWNGATSVCTLHPTRQANIKTKHLVLWCSGVERASWRIYVLVWRHVSLSGLNSNHTSTGCFASASLLSHSLHGVIPSHHPLSPSPSHSVLAILTVGTDNYPPPSSLSSTASNEPHAAIQ